MELNKIWVLGAGVMGCDLALDLAIHKYKPVLYDISETQLENAKKKIEQQFRLYKMLNPAISTTWEEIAEELFYTDSLKNISDAGLVIENITENFNEKKNLYLNFAPLINDKTIVAANTSCIPIIKLGSFLRHPEKMVGTHFMNPVFLKKFVEVIKSRVTSDETVSEIISFLKSIEEKTAIVNDSPGFVSNRVLMLTINESIRTVEEGIAKPADVDKIFKLGFAHSMGPLATADLIGLDTIMYSLQVLNDEFNDDKFKPCGLLVKMVEEGQLGKKTGKGFFSY